MKINELELNKSYLLLDLDGTKKEVKVLKKDWIVTHEEYTILFVNDDEKLKVFGSITEQMEFEKIEMKVRNRIC